MIFTEKITRRATRSPCALLAGYMGYGGTVTTLVLGFGLPQAVYGDDRPEPMIFDLVDPLGAKRGETEINTLLDFSPRTGQLEWSPEIEYSFADDYAVEFELPIENTSVKEYKVSLQGTFGKLDRGRMIHGWQAIGRRKNEEKAYAAEVLYLNDYKFSNKWSMMNMLGVRHTGIAKSGDFVGLLNNSVFYSFKENFSIGVEVNSEIDERKWRYRVTPQIQYNFGANGKGSIVHFGGGPSQLNDRERTEWLLTSRVIYSF
jgi:hypothetical protein